MSARSRADEMRWSLLPRIASRLLMGDSGKTSAFRRRSQVRSSCVTPSELGAAAKYAALMAPTDAPMTRSGTMLFRVSAFSMPTCTAPRLPPPASTNAVVPLITSAYESTIASACANRCASPTSETNGGSRDEPCGTRYLFDSSVLVKRYIDEPRSRELCPDSHAACVKSSIHVSPRRATPNNEWSFSSTIRNPCLA